MTTQPALVHAQARTPLRKDQSSQWAEGLATIAEPGYYWAGRARYSPHRVLSPNWRSPCAAVGVSACQAVSRVGPVRCEVAWGLCLDDPDCGTWHASKRGWPRGRDAIPGFLLFSMSGPIRDADRRCPYRRGVSSSARGRAALRHRWPCTNGPYRHPSPFPAFEGRARMI